MPQHSPDSPPQKIAIAISWAPGFKAIAHAFARQNELPIINELGQWSGLCFHLDKRGWSIVETAESRRDAFVLRFSSKYSAQGKDPLLRAMGKAKSVLDMTAGWGADALHIAESGRNVIALERHPVVYQLLQQARAGLDASLQQRLQFFHADVSASDFEKKLFNVLAEKPDFDLVYIDPMFAGKSAKSAKTKKPMTLLQKLVEPPSQDNERQLFDRAMNIAQQRVVVKRALKAPYLANAVPQGSIKSKLLRFDLYRP